MKKIVLLILFFIFHTNKLFAIPPANDVLIRDQDGDYLEVDSLGNIASSGLIVRQSDDGTKEIYNPTADTNAARWDALQDAYSDCTSGSGDTIIMKAGTYTPDATINLKNNCYIHMETGVVLTDNNLAFFSDNSSAITTRITGDGEFPARSVDTSADIESILILNGDSDIVVQSKNINFPMQTERSVQKKNAEDWINGQSSTGNFGVSIGFGIQTFVGYAGGSGEFGTGQESVNQFAPTALTKTAIHSWAEAAAQMGGDSVYIYAKHVPGFTFWPTETTTQGIHTTNWYKNNGQLDLMKEVTDSARARDLKTGMYYCVWDKYFEQNFDETDVGAFTDYTVRQLEELMKNYGKIDYLIIDCMPWQYTYEQIEYNSFIKKLRELQPNMVISINSHEEGILNTDVITREITTGDSVPTSATTVPTEGWQASNSSYGSCGTSTMWFHYTSGYTSMTDVGACAGDLSYRRGQSRLAGNRYIYNIVIDDTGAIASDNQTFVNYNEIESHNNVVEQDDFSLNGSESVGVALQSHVNDNGVTWTEIFADAAGDLIISPNGQVRLGTAATGVVATFDETPADADYGASLEWGFHTIPANWVAGVLVRAADDTHYYELHCNQGSGSAMNCNINSRTGGAVVNEKSLFSNQAISATDTFKSVIRVIGTEIRIWIYMNGVELVQYTVTDATVSATGESAIYLDGAVTSDTTGIYATHFKLLEDDSTAPAAPTNLAVSRTGANAFATWTDPVVDDLHRVRIKYSTDGGANYYVAETAVSADQLAVIDNLDPNQTYMFVAEAIDQDWNISSSTQPITSYGSNSRYKVVAAGTPYSLTATPNLLNFGTTDPVLTVSEKGRYEIKGCANVRLNGATTAADRTVTLKLRRITNTSADVPEAMSVLSTGTITTTTGTLASTCFASYDYLMVNSSDTFHVSGDISTVPSAGSVDVVSADIMANRIE